MILDYLESLEAFKPERWTTEFTEQLAKFAYFPFGGGQCVCLGQDFAMMGAMLIATILRRFRLTLASEESVEPHPVVFIATQTSDNDSSVRVLP